MNGRTRSSRPALPNYQLLVIKCMSITLYKLLLDIIGDTTWTSCLRYQSSSLYLFGENQFISKCNRHIMRREREPHTGKEVSKRDRVKNAQRSGGFHWLTTRERGWNAPHFEHYKVRIRPRCGGSENGGLLSEKINILLQRPCRKKIKIFFLNTGTQNVHAKSLKLRTYIPGHTVSVICKNPRRWETEESWAI